ncbi:hypothetical protein HN499_04720 [archaeon]|jgi:hypothetical protein|nr:hypothetical protein [archaeon]MBT6956204.1 hypothetical protein [archaeon]
MKRLKKDKRAELVQQLIIHLVLIGLIFGMFFLATVGRTNSRIVKQQVLEKQIALLIDAAEPGISIDVPTVNRNGVIGNVVLSGGKVFVTVNGLSSTNGYPYFSKYDVDVIFREGEGDSAIDDKFVIGVVG